MAAGVTAKKKLTAALPVQGLHIKINVYEPQVDYDIGLISRWRNHSYESHMCLLSMCLNAKMNLTLVLDSLRFYFEGELTYIAALHWETSPCCSRASFP